MMRYLVFAVLALFAVNACAQGTGVKDFQIQADTPFTKLQLLVSDTTSSGITFGRSAWTDAYQIILGITDSLGIVPGGDEDWLTYRDSLSPRISDTIFHKGIVNIGEDTLFTGILNVIGRIDQRFPITTNNVAIGANAGRSTATGLNNVAIGGLSMQNLSSGANNAALGNSALQAVTTGSGNLAVGPAAMQSVTTGSNNVGVGYLALGSGGGSASHNVAMGYNTLAFCSSNYNIGIGPAAIGGLLFSFGGDRNIAIGAAAGYGFQGAGNVAIGDSAGYNWTGSNALFIDNTPTTTPLIFGDFAADSTHIHGKFGFQTDGGTPDGIALMDGRQLDRGVIGFGLELAGDTLRADAAALADSLGGGGDPSVWFEAGAVPADDIADEIYHTGDVHIGDATMAGGGKLNVLGRIDQKYPTLSLRNVALGDNTLNGSVTGDHNVALGTNALRTITSGSYNFGGGLGAGDQITSGTGNVALGFQSLFLNSTSNNNVALGYQSLYSTTNEGNVGVGVQAGYSNTTGVYNMAIGPEALFANTTGSYNVAIGYRAAKAKNSGTSSIAIGGGALENATGANVAIGYYAGQTLTSGQNNFLLGDYAGVLGDGTFEGNVAIGNYAGYTLSGDGNMFIGYEAGKEFTGNNMLAIGYQSGRANVSGTWNTSVGERSLRDNTGGSNTALGSATLMKNTTGSFNTAMGMSAMSEGLTGTHNTAVGYLAGGNDQTGDDNTYVGSAAGLTTTSADANRNTAIGRSAGSSVTGDDNVFIGSNSGLSSTGNENVMIGSAAGLANISGSGNVFIGTTAGYNETGSNKLYIENSTSASPLIHGDFSTDEIFINGKLGYSTEGSTATTLAGRDASEDFTNVTIGTGLSLSAGTLSNTGIITEVDGSITNEGVLGVGAGSGTSATLTTNTSGGNPVTINAAGILAITESVSSNGGSITLTATEADGSATNELTIVEIDGVVQSTGKVTLDLDGASFAITESPADNFDIQIQPERIEDIVGQMVTGNTETGIAVTYDDVNAKLNFVVSGGSADGNGIFDASNDGATVPSDMDIVLTDHIDFDNGTLYIDAANGEIGINTQTPDAALNVESAGQIEAILEDISGEATLRLSGNQGVIGSTPHSIDLFNADADLNSGTSTRVASITTTRLSSTQPGLALNFNLAYNATGSTDEVMEIASRESGATNGYVTTRGGVRNDVLESSSTSVTLTTGDHVVVLTSASATTCNLPSVTTGNLGMVFEIYNQQNTGDVTIDASGTQTIDGSEQFTLEPETTVKLRAVRTSSPHWKIISIY